MKKVLKIHPKDNVLVALTDLSKGTIIDFKGEKCILLEDINAKHKFVIWDIAKNEKIYMYGVLVGKAKECIPKGALVHTHNLVHQAQDYKVTKDRSMYRWTIPDVSEFKNKTFLGYYRKDGSVGTENNWLVIPLVFCENRNVEVLRKTLVEKLGFGHHRHQNFNVSVLIEAYKNGESIETILEKDILINGANNDKNPLFPNVDGLKFLTHDGGCGGATSDSVALCHLLAGYIKNPNVSGATVLSLGCQHAQSSILQEALKKYAPTLEKPVYILEQQQSISEKEFLAQAVKKTFIGLMQANQIQRKPATLDKLVIGLECGGSDGFSGISANPALGVVSDLMVTLKGTVVLAEFPELNGVEQELINRCEERLEAEKFSQIMSIYNQKAEAVGAGFSTNPSPGNIKDGLITDAMKSAGAAKKGGNSPVTDVLDYTEQITKKGLNLLCTPGNDVESTTALAGSGVNLILFTTGLGTPTGNPVVPVIKISSNTKLYQKMPDIIDFNTGDIIEGKVSIEQKGRELLHFLVEIASGNIKTKSRKLGQDDFIPWKRGMSL